MVVERLKRTKWRGLVASEIMRNVAVIVIRTIHARN